MASINSLEVVGKNELPQRLLDRFPTATGALKVVRTYYDREKPNWILDAIKSGDLSEMSFGFTVQRSEDMKTENGKVRLLLDLDLFDTSDVLWGANAATIASLKSAAHSSRTFIDIGAIRTKQCIRDAEKFLVATRAGRSLAPSNVTQRDTLRRIRVALL